MEKIRKYWKEILMCVLLIFGMNKCSKSCNRANIIDKKNIEILQKDSIISKLKEDSTISAIRFSDAQASNDAYKGIATSNQQELVNKIEALTTENSKLNSQIKNLQSENLTLKKTISALKNAKQ